LTPQARLSAAIEVIDQIARNRASADSTLKAWGQAHRFAGSKDRRAIAERVYACLRAHARLEWVMGRRDGRALVLGSVAVLDTEPLEAIEALFSGEGHAPLPVSPEERERLQAAAATPPDWAAAGLSKFVAGEFQRAFGKTWREEAAALTGERAPIDLRVNTRLTSLDAAVEELAKAGFEAKPTPWSAVGLRLASDPAPDIQALDLYKSGLVEIQDEGSQLAAWLAGPRAMTTVVDYCAGGGGKTLALAQAGGKLKLVACDVDPRRLENIRPRLVRAGVEADLRRLGPEGEGTKHLESAADLVLVDAPCSGSGAWRRRPDEAFRLTKEEVDRLHALQVKLLARAAKLVKPGGRLAYVTCSMLASENEDTVDVFEAAHPDFKPRAITEALKAPQFTAAARARLAELAGGGHRLRLTPRTAQTDGFFVALYERSA
jgi:16S rRNA (cytosine967-C5)-methyltransferase